MSDGAQGHSKESCGICNWADWRFEDKRHGQRMMVRSFYVEAGDESRESTVDLFRTDVELPTLRDGTRPNTFSHENPICRVERKLAFP